MKKLMIAILIVCLAVFGLCLYMAIPRWRQDREQKRIEIQAAQVRGEITQRNRETYARMVRSALIAQSNSTSSARSASKVE